MLVKLNAILSQFHQHFTLESKLSSFSLISFGFAIFWSQNIGKKNAHKMLMKLTPYVRIIMRQRVGEITQWFN